MSQFGHGNVENYWEPRAKVSISSTLNARIYVQMSFWQLFSSYVYVKKLPKLHSYEKFVRIMLMKLTVGQSHVRTTGGPKNVFLTGPLFYLRICSFLPLEIDIVFD